MKVPVTNGLILHFLKFTLETLHYIQVQPKVILLYFSLSKQVYHSTLVMRSFIQPFIEQLLTIRYP